MNIALVYDRLNKIGGAERVLTELHRLFPRAPLFTAFYDPDRARWAQGWNVRTSFLSGIPGVASRHELFAWAAPYAFENFSFDGFDVVMTVTSAEAKGIITKPDTCHICYCLTPTRYLWSGVNEYESNPGIGILPQLVRPVYRRLLPKLREWDLIAAKRPDYYIAISQTVASRIRKYYGVKDVPVLYPPVDTDFFTPGGRDGDYYLTVARLVPYKRVDLIAAACAELGKKLVIVGRGHDERRVRDAGGKYVEIIREELTDVKLREYYRNCRAFLYAGVEDFGIALAEAQSCGKPVIARGEGGASEIVIEGKTGVLYSGSGVGALVSAIRTAEGLEISPQACRQNALRFSGSAFRTAMEKTIVQTVRRYRKEMGL